MRKFKYRVYQLSVVFKIYFFKIIFLFFHKNCKKCFLISERGTDARDNGYVFYKFLKTKDIKVKYVITKKSEDINKIDSKDIILYNSAKHYKYLLYSKYLVSTHIMGFTPNTSICMRLNSKKLLPIKGKTIFLQHGITKDYCKAFDYNYTHLSMFVCGAKREYEYIKNVNGYPDSVIKNIGFCRFDDLIDTSRGDRSILIMPTWRHWHNSLTKDKFKEEKFYKAYIELINNDYFLEYIAKNSIKVYFYLHYETQKFIDLFYSKSSNIIICSKNKYDVQMLLRKTNMLITDYSSVYFDFAYMKKKVIFYHFDYEDYRKIRPEGYFDYKKDGFGPIAYNNLELINMILDGFTINEEYMSRINNFFGNIDYNNCERTLTEILKLQ